MHTDRQIERQTDMHRCIHWYIYIVRCSTELAQLFPLSYSWGRSTRYSDRFINFLSPFVDVTRMSISTVSFLAQLGFCLGFSLPIEYFPLTYDHNGLKSIIRRLLTVGFFLNRFPVCFNLFVTGRWTDGRTDGGTDRQTDRQTEIHAKEKQRTLEKET